MCERTGRGKGEHLETLFFPQRGLVPFWGCHHHHPGPFPAHSASTAHRHRAHARSPDDSTPSLFFPVPYSFFYHLSQNRYWQSKIERSGKSPLSDPAAIIGILAIFFPFVILGIAIATGYVDVTAGRV